MSGRHTHTLPQTYCMASCRDHSLPYSWLIYRFGPHILAFAEWIKDFLVPPPLRLVEHIGGRWKSAVVHALAVLRVPDTLGPEEQTSQDLAARLGTACWKAAFWGHAARHHQLATGTDAGLTHDILTAMPSPGLAENLHVLVKLKEVACSCCRPGERSPCACLELHSCWHSLNWCGSWDLACGTQHPKHQSPLPCSTCGAAAIAAPARVSWERREAHI